MNGSELTARCWWGFIKIALQRKRFRTGCWHRRIVEQQNIQALDSKVGLSKKGACEDKAFGVIDDL